MRRRANCLGSIPQKTGGGMPGGVEDWRRLRVRPALSVPRRSQKLGLSVIAGGFVGALPTAGVCGGLGGKQEKTR